MALFNVALFILYFYTIKGSDYFKDIARCILTKKGEEYIGKVSTTKTGKDCQMWSQALETPKEYKETYFSNKNITLSMNYCRNPNSNPDGPWCFIEEDNWEVCSIPICERDNDCKDTESGVEYSGFINITKEGISCQPWMNQNPHAHKFQALNFSENDFIITGNKCRNPNNRHSPWCFTINPQKTWDYCNVPQCEIKISQDQYFQGKNSLKSLHQVIIEDVMDELVYNVTVSVTVSVKLWTEEVQSKTSVWSTEFAYQCQKDLDYYKYCYATHLKKNEDKIKITFLCKNPLKSVILIIPLVEEQHMYEIKKGPQYLVNNLLSPTIETYKNEISKEITDEDEDAEIFFSDNGGSFYLLDENVFPYAVSKKDKIVMAFSNVGKGRIGFMGGQYFTEVGLNSKLLKFFKKVSGLTQMEFKVLTRTYFRKLKKSWRRKEVLNISLIWNAHNKLKRRNTKVLLDMVKNGLILIIEIKPWAYYYYTNKFEVSELKEIFWAAGVWPTLDVVVGNLRIVKEADLKYLPLIYLIEYAKTNINALFSVSRTISDTLINIRYYDNSEILVTTDLMTKLKLKVSELYQMYLPHITSFVPCLKKPLVNTATKVIMNLFNKILLKSFGNNVTAPGINFYPGSVDIQNTLLESFRIKLKLKYNNENVYTGIYVPAAQNVTVSLTSLKSKMCDLIINFHLFDISNKKKFNKWPATTRKYVIRSNNTISIVNSFGGLLSITCDANDDNVVIKVINVVQAAIYDRRNKVLGLNWNKLKNRNVPWAILAGDSIVFIVPIIATRNLENPNAILEIWDKMVKEEFHVRGRSLTKTYRELLSADIKILAGYMHNGYPIGTYMQHIVNPALIKNYVFSNSISKTGSWGITHEIGHNLQHDIFTFTGTDEVTNNIFTLAATESITGYSSWNQSQGWVSEDKLPKIIKHINKGNFTFWINEPYVALGTYAQLRAQFGWEFYRQIFRNYDKLIIKYGKRVNSMKNEKKISLWIIETSKVAGMNLIPLYEYWAWPISEKVKAQLNKYSLFLPDDFLTKMTQNKVNEILSKYEHVSRNPLPIPIIVGPLKNALVIEGEGGIEEITLI